MPTEMKAPGFRRFILERFEDINGNTGVGVVAYGTVFPSGRAVLNWKGTSAIPEGATGIYASIDSLLDTHNHVGRTLVSFVDQTDPVFLLSKQLEDAIADDVEQVLEML